MVVTGTSIEDARDGLWLLGPFTSTRLWQPWTLRALSGADWSAVLDQAAGIATAVFVAVHGVPVQRGRRRGAAPHRSRHEPRNSVTPGWVNVVTGLFGGSPAITRSA